MMQKVKSFFRRKVCAPMIGAMTVCALSVPAFAAEPVDPVTGVVDPAAFDPLVTAVTGNVSALMPKVLVVVGLILGVTVAIGFFKRHAK